MDSHNSVPDFYFATASDEHIRRERAKARELRGSQWWRQEIGKGVCYHCGMKFLREELTMDHVIPVSRGGKSNKKNIVVSCKQCNSLKKNLTAAEMRLREITN